MGETSGIWWQKPLMLKKSFTFNNEVFEFAEDLFYNLRTGEIKNKKQKKQQIITVENLLQLLEPPYGI